ADRFDHAGKAADEVLVIPRPKLRRSARLAPERAEPVLLQLVAPFRAFGWRLGARAQHWLEWKCSDQPRYPAIAGISILMLSMRSFWIYIKFLYLLLAHLPFF